MVSIEIVEHTGSGGANLSSLRLRRKNIFYLLSFWTPPIFHMAKTYENQTYNHVGKTKMNLSDVDGSYHSFMVNLGKRLS